VRAGPSPGADDGEGATGDAAVVAELLGRVPTGEFEVVVRAEDGKPAVIANAPFLFDGTPMPTRYWLVDPGLREAVSRVESVGGVRQAEAAVAPDRIAAAHARYAEERDALIAPEHRGPRPTGGVGGTRSGLVAGGGRRPGRRMDRAPHRPPPLLTATPPGPTVREAVVGPGVVVQCSP
jgi:uncharacterized protein